MVKIKAVPGQKFSADDYLAKRLDLIRRAFGAEEMKVTLVVGVDNGLPSFRLVACSSPSQLEEASPALGIKEPSDPESVARLTWDEHLIREDAARFIQPPRSELR